MVTVTVDTVEALPLNTDELLEQAIHHFDMVTANFIHSKVEEYNRMNGTSFGDVYRCELYSRMQGYSHQAFCIRVWKYNVAIWEAVRAYQQSATIIPTDDEFMTILNGVVF